MTSKHKKQNRRLLSLISILLLVVILVMPPPVYARRNIFQKIGRALRKTVTFIVRLPDKSTRWMGPVLGPIAANILTGNLAQSAKFGRIFTTAQRAQRTIDEIQQQKKLISDLKDAYREEADKLDAIAGELHQSRQDLARDLAQGEIDFDTFKSQAVALEKLAQSYEATAGQFRTKADAIDERTVIGMVTKNAANLLIGRVKDAVVYEVNTEISRLIKGDVISRLLGKDSENTDLLIDLLADSDLKDFLRTPQGAGLNEKDLKDRLRERIKELIKESRSDLKDNWREKIQEVLGQLADQMKQDKDKLPEPPAKNEVPAAVDEHGCRTGWIWENKVGKCIQENCNSIENAHWSYVFDCVCGSSGSINENPQDPNKECGYSQNHAACPGCVYACVHLDEDCPLEGIGD